MAREVLRSSAWVLSVSVGDDVSYELAPTEPGDNPRVRIVAPGDSVDQLCTYLATIGGARAAGADLGDLRTAVSADLVELSAAAAREADLGRYPYWTVRDTVSRWCHQAGVPSETFQDSNRVSREHILLIAPQPGTGRAITLGLTFRTRGEPSDHVTFTEEYRAPDEILGYSYAKAISYADLPALVAHLEGDGGVPGDPEDRLIKCFEQLLANGTLDPAAGQAAVRDRVLSWIHAAGLRELSGHRGYARRETLLQVPLDGGRQLSLSFSIDAYSKQLGFQEGYGSSTDKWRNALYQLQFPYSSAANLLTWLEARVEPPPVQLSVDDRLVAGFRSLTERGDLQPGRPMAVRDRVAGWLTEAGVEYKSYGTSWTETLVQVHRDNDCIFTLQLILDPEREDRGVVFSEQYDYLPVKGDSGREYAYTTYAPYDSLPTLADSLEAQLGRRTDGTADARLIACLVTLVERGELGNELPLRLNHQLVAGWFTEAGVPVQTDVWSWINSD